MCDPLFECTCRIGRTDTQREDASFGLITCDDSEWFWPLCCNAIRHMFPRRSAISLSYVRTASLNLNRLSRFDNCVLYRGHYTKVHRISFNDSLKRTKIANWRLVVFRIMYDFNDFMIAKFVVPVFVGRGVRNDLFACGTKLRTGVVNSPLFYIFGLRLRIVKF